mmetsp:Transcript_32790/g.54356  ORF Transcript_32790/g.54356 Transcript_32790/m.54356 type:complete len:159 (+) Transcript_32790:1627-2103(+)
MPTDPTSNDSRPVNVLTAKKKKKIAPTPVTTGQDLAAGVGQQKQQEPSVIEGEKQGTRGEEELQAKKQRITPTLVGELNAVTTRAEKMDITSSSAEQENSPPATNQQPAQLEKKMHEKSVVHQPPVKKKQHSSASKNSSNLPAAGGMASSSSSQPSSS